MMKYYYYEHIAGYERMLAEGKRSWGEVQGHPDDFENFSSRSFLEEILPRLAFEAKKPGHWSLGLVRDLVRVFWHRGDSE